MLVHEVNSVARCGWNRGASRLPPMAKRARKELEPWQQQDAARLRALWLKAKSADPDLSQRKFAEDNHIGDESQGIVWQYINGAIPLNLDVAVKFADGLNCDVRDFSPTLADRRTKLTEPSDGRLPFAYDIPQDLADELLAYFEQLSSAQRNELLKNMREVVEANEVVRSRLNVTRLSHPEDDHVAKALTKVPSRLPQDEPKRRGRRQLPLLKGLRKPQ